MITNFGRVLRKIRVDHCEIQKNMAERLGATGSYLSAVEKGKQPIPKAWEKIIVDNYPLSENQKEELRRAVIESLVTIRIDVRGARYAVKEAAFAFARKAADLPDDKLLEIKRILGSDAIYR